MRKRRWGFGKQWHQLDHMQTICTSLLTDNQRTLVICHHLIFYELDAIPDAQPNQQCQSTEGTSVNIKLNHKILCALKNVTNFIKVYITWITKCKTWK